jgi:hypothetical protein
MFSLQQNQRTRGKNRFCPETGGWGMKRREYEVAQIMYAHVSVKTIK